MSYINVNQRRASTTEGWQQKCRKAVHSSFLWHIRMSKASHRKYWWVRCCVLGNDPLPFFNTLRSRASNRSPAATKRPSWEVIKVQIPLWFRNEDTNWKTVVQHSFSTNDLCYWETNCLYWWDQTCYPWVLCNLPEVMQSHTLSVPNPAYQCWEQHLEIWAVSRPPPRLPDRANLPRSGSEPSSKCSWKIPHRAPNQNRSVTPAWDETALLISMPRFSGNTRWVRN